MASSRALRFGQRGLPLVFLTLGVLEFAAVVFTSVRTMEVPEVIAAIGPAGFIPVTMAVVFATLLPAERSSVPHKATAAVGAAFFAGARIALLVLVATSADALTIQQLLVMISGAVMGIGLLAWQLTDYKLAVKAPASRRGGRRPADGSPNFQPEPRPEPVAVAQSPVEPPHPVREAPRMVVRPTAPVPRVGGSVAESPEASAAKWHKGTTPWPRKNEEDPDGTLLRPPRRVRR